MIVYAATKSVFANDILSNRIDEKIQSCLRRSIGRGVAESELKAFRNSLRYMDTVLQEPSIPSDIGISIEYQIPQTAKRIDFIISGKDERSRPVAILIELKQWQEATLTKMDGVVSTVFSRGPQEVSHPSYQAWSYAALLEDFNETVRNDNVLLKPCAYLHNYEPDDVITNDFYAEYLQKAPVFLKPDAKKLQQFIKQFVRHGDSGEIMYRIDRGRIKPSKNLADQLASLLKGNKEFVMIDDQKLVYEKGLALAECAGKRSKQVLIVEGGPGTGKSVVAVNLLVELTNRQFTSHYVTKNAAPRAVYQSKLTGTMTRTRITNLFQGSGEYTKTTSNAVDVLIVDEAHRLNEKSGFYQSLGENQVMELIKAAKLSIFFLDENQRVTLRDIGNKETIVEWAKKLNATVHHMTLSSQFRCNGSDGYLAWLDNTLQIRETANVMLDPIEYDFRVCSSPTELRDLIFEKNEINNKARLVAGYCWKWRSKKDPGANDIVIPEHNFEMCWNLTQDGSLWIVKPESVTEVGCIHTCQGLELDYVGVIIGLDLVARDDKICTDPAARASEDSSVRGYRQQLQRDPAGTKAKIDMLIKNTYRTLMTRGMKGCYVYCVDKELEALLKSRMQPSLEKSPLYFSDVIRPEEEEFVVIESEVDKALQYVEYLPLYSLEAACGGFGEGKLIEEEGWVKVLNRKLNRNMFIAKAIGRSMEPLIRDGDFCIFRSPVVGSRANKIVLVQHTSIKDDDTGTQFTVKKYTSKKRYSKDGKWEHEAITLLPLNRMYRPIDISNSEEGDFIVVAEFVDILRPS